MTPDELAAIRGRDEGWRSSVNRLVADEHWVTAADRSALLAEVDRLMAEAAKWQGIAERLDADVEAVTANALRYEAEVDRLNAEVERLRGIAFGEGEIE
jgi:hypothetical protein